MNSFFQELNSILNSYTEDRGEFEFVNHFKKSPKIRPQNNEMTSPERHLQFNVLSHSNLTYNFTFDNYNNVFHYNQPLHNPEEYLSKDLNKRFDRNTKFDLFVNILFAKGLQNIDLLNFIMNESGKILTIGLDSRCLDDLKKRLIAVELETKSSVIQRFQHFETISETAAKLSVFKNLVITTESIELCYFNLHEFLYDKQNTWLFRKEHFDNQIEIASDEIFNIELKFAIISCLRN